MAKSASAGNLTGRSAGGKTPAKPSKEMSVLEANKYVGKKVYDV